MAVVKKKLKTKSDEKTRSRKRKRITLPTRKSDTIDDLGKTPIMIYGDRKIGKTTLAGQFPSNFFFMFEPNQTYSLYQKDIAIWEDFLELTDQIIEGDHDFRTVTIDTGQPAYSAALEYACRVHGFSHPTDEGYGKGWDMLRKDFYSPVLKLMRSGLGFIVICHALDKDIKTRSGNDFQKMVPELSKQADTLWTSQIYNIFYYGIEGTDRFLQILGDDYITAGHRMKGHFLTPAGERVWRVPMGDSEDEAFENLMIAFNNKQKDSFKPTSRSEKVEQARKYKKKKTIHK